MWESNETCYFSINDHLHKTSIAFDFDDTLVYRFTSNPMENVSSVLKDLGSKFNIVIFTNQKGISSGKSTHDSVRNLIDKFRSDINIPITVFYSTEDDVYRKPMKGMYDLYSSVMNHTIDIKYYCGDACGRKNDFSISDLYFANNCNLQFKTPEEIFTKKSPQTLFTKKLASLKLYQNDIWNDGYLKNKRNIIPINSDRIDDIINKLDIPSKEKTLIIMVGPQAVGKSTLSNKLSSKCGLGIINNDTQKKMSTMKKYFEKYSLDKECNGIIIDNTNSTNKTRSLWIDMFKAHNMNKPTQIKIVFFNIEKNISIHLNKYRIFNYGIKIPTIAIHKYYKNLETPDLNNPDTLILEDIIHSGKCFNQNLRFC